MSLFVFLTLIFYSPVNAAIIESNVSTPLVEQSSDSNAVSVSVNGEYKDVPKYAYVDSLINWVKDGKTKLTNKLSIAFSSDWSTIYQEVVNQLNKSWDNGYAQGMTQGDAEGYNEGYASGKNHGYDEGYSEGIEEGSRIGKEVGYKAGYEAGQNNTYQNNPYWINVVTYPVSYIEMTCGSETMKMMPLPTHSDTKGYIFLPPAGYDSRYGKSGFAYPFLYSREGYCKVSEAKTPEEVATGSRPGRLVYYSGKYWTRARVNPTTVDHVLEIRGG